MSLLERIGYRLAAAALAEEGEVDAARAIEAEVEDDEAGPREGRTGPPASPAGGSAARGGSGPAPTPRRRR
ncbi:MAG TPA: hypothetical protein VFF02_17295 [Anaeromyxobacteraceae bacterium]|nr:hypothetical protein [Anaeromyxobacteraceae bacterium]